MSLTTGIQRSNSICVLIRTRLHRKMWVRRFIEYFRVQASLPPLTAPPTPSASTEKPLEHDWSTLVAVLGTTISPYLFFWQAAQEQEERQNPVPRMVIRPNHQTLRVRALDIGLGTFYSNLVMFFVILTTALTLHANAVTNLNTTQDVSRALRPLAGSFATGLFTLGLVAVGLLAIPTLTGSAAYAIAETMKWRHGLHHKFAAARPFYGVIILSTVIGIILDFRDVSPVRALYWASILNGLLAPFLLMGMVVVASDRRIMYNQCSSLLARAFVGMVALLLLGVAVGMFVF